MNILAPLGCGLPGVFGITRRTEGLGPSECNGSTDLPRSGAMKTLDDLLRLKFSLVSLLNYCQNQNFSYTIS
jgi:hypothetical protein